MLKLGTNYLSKEEIYTERQAEQEYQFKIEELPNFDLECLVLGASTNQKKFAEAVDQWNNFANNYGVRMIVDDNDYYEIKSDYITFDTIYNFLTEYFYGDTNDADWYLEEDGIIVLAIK